MSFTIIRRLATKAERFVPTLGVYPKGFSVGGIHCGVKKDGKSLDLAMLVNTHSESAVAAGVFTKNKFKAAPVVLCQEIVKEKNGSDINSIIINSGNANSGTGTQGKLDAQAMVTTTDAVVGNKTSNSTLVMSTGVIGNHLPIENILTGIPTVYLKIGDDHEHWLECAKAICTTDTFPKLVSKRIEINGVEYAIAGLAKGAGMICPNMATLLGFFVTDAPVTAKALRQILGYATERSFNSISVDGDMSTNDTIVAIANGAAGGPLIDNTAESSESFAVLKREITTFAQSLAQLVVRDGEGATKFITLRIRDALSHHDAKIVASSIANLALVKTAMYGKDANWGRILCAVGYAPVGDSLVNMSKIAVRFIPADGSDSLQLITDGEPEEVDEARASEILEFEDVTVEVDLGTGGGQSCEYWTCDLSHDYVTINGDYRS